MPSKSIKIFVATPNGEKTTSIELHPSSTILDVKSYLNHNKRIPTKDLIYKFQILSDEKTLEEIGLVNGSTLQLVPKSNREVFTIFIKTYDGEFITLTVRPFCTVLELKVHLNGLKKEIPAENQNLCFNSQVLSDDKTIMDIGVINGSTIRLVPKDAQQVELSSLIEIFVKTHNEESISIKVEPKWTIFDIKKYLFHLKRIPVWRQNLIYRYETLGDEKTVQDIGLVDGSSLKLVLNMVNGFQTHLRTSPSDPVKHFISYITFIRIFRQGELILGREVNKFYCVTSTSEKLNNSLTKLVLANLGLNLHIIYDKEDYGRGSFIRLTYSGNSRELYEEELLKCGVAHEDPPSIVVQTMPCDMCGLEMDNFELYICKCNEIFCENHKLPETHNCKLDYGGATKRSN